MNQLTVKDFNTYFMNEYLDFDNIAKAGDNIIVKREALGYNKVVEKLVKLLSNKELYALTIYIVHNHTSNDLVITNERAAQFIKGYFTQYNDFTHPLNVIFTDGSYSNPGRYAMTVDNNIIKADRFPEYVAHIQRELLYKIL